MEFPIRKIIHIDMDAFYASVEQLDHPEYRGKPLAVGGSKERGVVAAASYEARKYGVRSAMPSKTAWKKCPHIVFVAPRFDRYRALSKQIRAILYEYTDWVEPLSLDEAYLDVTENKKGINSATQIAKLIREQIYKETGLTASAGISINKFLAKTASDINKPNGQKVIPPDEVLEFLEQLPIEKFFGVGKVTAQKMKSKGIHTGADLKKWDKTTLSLHFGKAGIHYYNIVRGVQKSAVKPNRIRKSLGAERTFSQDLVTIDEMRPYLEKIASRIAEGLENSKTSGRTVTLKIKYLDFVINTRSKTFSEQIQTKEQLLDIAMNLLCDPIPERPVRLLGISISNLNTAKQNQSYIQLSLDF